MFTRTMRLLLTGTAAVSGIAASQAGAQTTPNGTAAGVLVTNTANATYSVNGQSQTTASNAATFVVDRKVNLTVVALQSADTQVNQGQVGAVTTYRVTNKTNAIQDILLDGDQNLSLGLGLGTDNFDMQNLKAYVDSNGNNQYDPGVDTATFIDELAPDGAVTVFLVGDVPASSAQLAIVNLHATVAAGGQAGTKGAALTATLLNSKDDVDVVFADADTDGVGADLLRDGQARAYLAYVVGIHDVALSVTKSSFVVSDGVSTLNPKALPGAVVEYCLAVRNATLGTGANAVTLTDVIPTNTTYVPGSLKIGLPGGSCVLLGGEAQDDDATDDTDGTTYKGSFDTQTKTVTAIIPTVNGGAAVSAAFNVTIN
ncbi:DUF11 domain-containing protein [Microvirga sp. SRT01]|jgi:uncharacterized repeat protein (TIGR01451 family)|uniref:DUF11 domain-containing protein n=1 Tax=Sphingomonas longa TaxID=2778730 RepID=A0ABS2DB52_9SPHN|nr:MULTISPECIES: DUF11 domain-containing protein [Alphaproteobacteria]MBM6578171.1 DUF11 domain-containing protein [Sphingomonas sp. BT552]MBR7711212.1 DUF11 domain-containing protein [Microvirga sp. SRT01]